MGEFGSKSISERNRRMQLSSSRLAEIDRAADVCVHCGSAKLLGVDVLSDRGLHQRGAGEIELAPFSHKKLVAENREVSAAGHAMTHHRRVLGNSHGREDRVVAENPAEIILIGKDFVLHRQINSRRVNQVNERQIAAGRNFLARRTFLTVAGKNAPAFTVASLATIMQGRPWTGPTPVITPAAGTSPTSGYIR